MENFYYKDMLLTNKDEILEVGVISDSKYEKEAYYYIIFNDESKKRYKKDYKEIEELDYKNLAQSPEYGYLRSSQQNKFPICYFKDWKNETIMVYKKKSYIDHTDKPGSPGKIFYGDEKLKHKNYFCIDELTSKRYEISYGVYFDLQRILKEKNPLDRNSLS